MLKDGPLCHQCPLREAKGPVWGSGSPYAKAVFVGMAPEQTEVETGIPFSGGAGRVLNRGLWSAGISREKDIYITNIIKCFLAAGSSIPPEAAKCCKPLLEKELGMLKQCTTTVALGQEAFYHLSNGMRLYLQHNAKQAKKGVLTDWLRGAPLRSSTESRNCLLGTYHPSGIARAGFATFDYFLADLKKVKRYITEGIQTWKEDYDYHPTDKVVEQEVDECINSKRYGLDIETTDSYLDADEEEYTGSEAEITVVGISSKLGHCVGVTPAQVPLLRRLFEKPDVTCYSFNWGFDGYHLGKEYRIANKAFDVMYALHELYSDISPKDLGTALSLFTDLPYHKNLMKSKPDLYNCRDTYGALAAGLTCEKLLDQYKLRQLFETHDMPTIPVLLDLEHIGAKCDVDLANRLELECYLKLEKYEEFWNKALPNVLWTSTDQLLDVFSRQGLPIKKVRRKRKDGTTYYSPSLDEDVLKGYRDGNKSQLAGLVLEMRKLKKAKDFCHVFSTDGRMHTRYKGHGTGTGRLATREPNAGNIPEKIADIYPRSIIIPDSEEEVFIMADFSQMQLWIYAYAAQDEAFLKAKKTGDYIHGKAYEDLFNRPFFEQGKPRIKAYKLKTVTAEELLNAKTIPLGLCFGREIESLVVDSGLPRAKATLIYNNFHKEHPAIHRFHRVLDDEVAKKGYLQNFFGRIRRFPRGKGQRNEYLNFPGQSNESDILRKNALLPLHRYLPGYKARIVLTVYDSLGVSCPKSNLRSCVEFIRDSLETPIPEMNNFWIPCEISVGPNWNDQTLWEDYVNSI